jgi:hypothetical protein
MHPVELRVIRGLIGVRAGLGGPMSQERFGSLLFLTGRTVRNYESGRRAIPPLVAKEARRLRDGTAGKSRRPA